MPMALAWLAQQFPKASVQFFELRAHFQQTSVVGNRFFHQQLPTSAWAPQIPVLRQKGFEYFLFEPRMGSDLRPSQIEMLPVTCQQPGLDFRLGGAGYETYPFAFQRVLEPVEVGSPVRIRQEKPKVKMPPAFPQLAFDGFHGLVIAV